MQLSTHLNEGLTQVIFDDLGGSPVFRLKPRQVIVFFFPGGSNGPQSCY